MEWHKFPVVEMVKRCWIPKAKDLKENAEELMRNFISLAGGFETVSIALFRQGKSARYNSKMDPYALTAWCIRVLLSRHVGSKQVRKHFAQICSEATAC